MRKQSLVCLDVGEKRIGVAVADPGVRIVVPFETVIVDGQELVAIAAIMQQQDTNTIVVGYPRNQQGDTTAQSVYVEQFAKKLNELGYTVEFQDESLTSVLAEQHLKESGKPYTKGDIDRHAAALILQDYVEAQHG